MKIERQLNQRINSINLEPIRWYFRSFNIFSCVPSLGSGDRDRNAYATATSALISADWSLAISEHGLLRMPIGKRSRGGGHH